MVSTADQLQERIARLGDALPACREKRARQYRRAVEAGNERDRSARLMRVARLDQLARTLEASRQSALELLRQLEPDTRVDYRCDKCRQRAVPNGRGGYEHADPVDAIVCELLAGVR